jgi:hypothetical protein
LYLGLLHTWGWEPVTITLQALSLVGKAELVQVRFTLSLRDQRSMWMQDGCKVYIDSYMASNGLCFMVNWTIFKNHMLEVGWKHKTRRPWHFDAHNWWFILFYHVWGPYMNRMPLKLHLVDFTLHLKVRDHTTWFWRCVGTAFRHLLLDSHNFMVTALGSCVKWPLVSPILFVLLKINFKLVM